MSINSVVKTIRILSSVNPSTVLSSDLNEFHELQTEEELMSSKTLVCVALFSSPPLWYAKAVPILNNNSNYEILRQLLQIQCLDKALVKDIKTLVLDETFMAHSNIYFRINGFWNMVGHFGDEGTSCTIKINGGQPILLPFGHIQLLFCCSTTIHHWCLSFYDRTVSAKKCPNCQE